MTDEKIELSRRKVLGSLGAIGVASAGAGLGTTAYFSDEETFKNNTLTAGSLDLKVDWEEHYSNGMGDETNADTLMSSPSDSDADQYVALPDPQNPMLWVHTDDLRTFREETAIEAYPDRQDDGWQDRVWLGRETTDACEVLADLPSGLDSDYRTEGTVNGQTTEPGDPLVNLNDLKPGDFGELTLSYHLCDNPGYVWATGQLVSKSENGVTEPEASDPDEEEGVVELLDTVQTALWYDDGDNVLSGGGTVGGAADVVIVADGSGSVTTDSSKFQSLQDGAEDLVNAVGNNVNVGLVTFADSADDRASLADSNSTVISAIQDDTNYPGGGTDVGAGITEGQDLLTNGAGARSGVNKVLVVLTNGVSGSGRSQATTAKNAGTTIYGIAYGSGADEDLIEDISSPPKNDDGSIDSQDQFAFDADQTDIGSVFTNIGGQISTGEEVIFRGTLRETLNLLSGKKVNGASVPYDAPGIALDAGDEFDEVIGGPERPAPGGADTRQCFEASSSHYLGFAWWLPIDHGNEVQSDGVSFDIGFYTEQCRRNDGSGMNGLVPTRRGSGFVKLAPETNQGAGYGEDGANFNGDGTESSFARARFGNNLSEPGDWELAVGNSTGDSTKGGYQWTPGETVEWTYAYSASDDRAVFILDGNRIEYTGLDEQPDGRVGIQAKANDATVDVEDVAMVVSGQNVALSGANSVTASNDGDGRDIEYLVINSDLDGDTNFTVEGSVTVTLGDDFGGSEEDVALDVVLE